MFINYYKYCTESLVYGYYFSFVSAERTKISRTIKKAEKNAFPLNPFHTKKRFKNMYLYRHST